MSSWKKLIYSGSNAAINQLTVSTSVTASAFVGSFVGNASNLTNYSYTSLNNIPSGIISSSNQQTISSITTPTVQSVVFMDTANTKILVNSSNFTFNTANKALFLTGSLNVSGSVKLNSNIINKGNIEITGSIYSPEIKTINFLIDGGASVITTGAKGRVSVDDKYRIQSWVMYADQSGSIKVDVRKMTYNTYATTTTSAGHSIAVGGVPTITNNSKASGSSSSWANKIINAGDVLEFFVTGSVTSITKVTTALRIRKIK